MYTFQMEAVGMNGTFSNAANESALGKQRYHQLKSSYTFCMWCINVSFQVEHPCVHT